MGLVIDFIHAYVIPFVLIACYLSFQVNKAYKRALLKFHPDRVSKADIRQQVEAEEKFKLISRMKEKFLPTA